MRTCLLPAALAATGLAVAAPATAQSGEIAETLGAQMEACEEAMIESSKASDYTIASTACDAALVDVQEVAAAPDSLSSEEKALTDFALMNLYTAKVVVSNKMHGKDVPEETCPLLEKAVSHADGMSVAQLPENVKMQAQFFARQARSSEANCPDETP